MASAASYYWQSVARSIRHAPVEMDDDDVFEIVHQLLMRYKDPRTLQISPKPTQSYGLESQLGRAISEWIRHRHDGPEI